MLLNYLEPSYRLGFLTVHVYGAFLALGLLVGLWLATGLARERGISKEALHEAVIVTVLGALVGARLFSVILNPAPYLEHPLSILLVHEGGLAFHGALGGGILLAAVYFWRKKGNFWNSADSVAPSLALGEAIARLGCDVYGYPSALAPFPRIIGGVPFHNVPLYTAVTSVLAFFVLWRFRKVLLNGNLFLLYLALYGAARAFIDYFRGEPAYLSVLNSAQLGSLGLMVLALALLAIRNRSRLKAGLS